MLLVLPMLVALADSDSGSKCTGGEIFDSVYDVRAIAAPATTDPCPDDSTLTGSTLEFVQLFTPASIPWNYTRLCFRVTFTNTPATQPVTVVAYNSVNGHPEDAPFTTVSSSFTPSSWSRSARASSYSNNNWRSVVVQGIVVTRARVYLGLRLTAPCSGLSFYVSSGFVSRQSFYRAPGATWIRNLGDWSTDNNTAVLLRASGSAYTSAPPGWNCPPADYNSHGACDCNCGLWDPDCGWNVSGSRSSICNSAAGEVCGPDGKCIAPGWDESISGCNMSFYGSGDSCQCGCGGLLDPDCGSVAAAGNWHRAAPNCPGGGISYCSDDNKCVSAWASASCPASAFFDRKFCNCGCQASGVLDPDCTKTNVSDCGDGSHCFEGACRPFPQNWTCAAGSYNASDGCDCACGLYDPDCATQSGTDTKGCGWSSGTRATKYYVCNLSNQCVLSKCGNGVVETNTEQCELGGTGCDTMCKCLAGWTTTSPLYTTNCVPNCGDGQLVGNEQCDGGTFCSSTCKCLSGHNATVPPSKYCTGCGNGVLEAYEDCDSGEGCNALCHCRDGYSISIPTGTGCTDNSKGNGGTLAMEIAIPVGGGGVIALGGVIAALVVAKKRKARAPNLPIDMGQVDFVPTELAQTTGPMTLSVPAYEFATTMGSSPGGAPSSGSNAGQQIPPSPGNFALDPSLESVLPCKYPGSPSDPHPCSSSNSSGSLPPAVLPAGLSRIAGGNPPSLEVNSMTWIPASVAPGGQIPIVLENTAAVATNSCGGASNSSGSVDATPACVPLTLHLAATPAGPTISISPPDSETKSPRPKDGSK